MILLNITFNFQVNIRHQDSMVRAFRLNVPNPAKQEATVKGVVCLPQHAPSYWNIPIVSHWLDWAVRGLQCKPLIQPKNQHPPKLTMIRLELTHLSVSWQQDKMNCWIWCTVEKSKEDSGIAYFKNQPLPSWVKTMVSYCAKSPNGEEREDVSSLSWQGIEAWQ